jgi:hypothetical protein
LGALTDRREQLVDAQEIRNVWLAENADTLNYRQQLADQIADRRNQLGDAAVTRQPEHLVELLGPVPADADEAEHWIRLATRIEAYREEWAIKADQLHHRPGDHLQAAHWELNIGSVLESQRLQAQLAALHIEPDRALDHGLSLDW